MRARKMRLAYLYIRAVCYKLIGNAAETEKHYKDIQRMMHVAEKKEIKLFIFGLLLAPLSSESKGLLEQMNRYDILYRKLNFSKEPGQALEKTLFDYYKNKPYWKWKEKKEIAGALQKMSFFKRFSEAQLGDIMDDMQIRKYGQNALVLLSTDEVGIISRGNAVIYSHENKLNHPCIIARYGTNIYPKSK